MIVHLSLFVFHILRQHESFLRTKFSLLYVTHQEYILRRPLWTRSHRLCESYVYSRVNLPRLNFIERETSNERKEARLLILWFIHNQYKKISVLNTYKSKKLGQTCKQNRNENELLFLLAPLIKFFHKQKAICFRFSAPEKSHVIAPFKIKFILYH